MDVAHNREDKVQVAVRIARSLKAEFDMKLAKDQRYQQDVVEALIYQYVHGADAPMLPRPEYAAPEAVIEQLIEFWRSPEDEHREALRNMVCTFIGIPRP